MDIPIVDDDVLENSELFNVTLERNGLDSAITLDWLRSLIMMVHTLLLLPDHSIAYLYTENSLFQQSDILTL